MSNRKHPGFFAWYQTIAGVQPQWWAELYYGERDCHRPNVVAVFELREEDVGLSPDELAQRYPRPSRSDLDGDDR